ncbi:hypothetical protein K0M31_003454 [Melipona bicolor]|uniref:Uncharacterized protein n=1 Tax=Melipona bicolor TaxID=60889 RepID=A0AA40KPI1_9HYME|nr:hypothetical protein K0M31_003454 [Melipona bicolor]
MGALSGQIRLRWNDGSRRNLDEAREARRGEPAMEARKPEEGDLQGECKARTDATTVINQMLVKPNTKIAQNRRPRIQNRKVAVSTHASSVLND